MHKSFTKIVAFILALMMVLSLSTAVFALGPPSGSGTGILDDPDPTENQQERPEEESTQEPELPVTAQGTQGVVEDTRTVGVTLSKGASSSTQFVDADHTYKAVKILDLYKVMDADGVNQAVDGDNNPIWQYRIADEWANASELAGLLNDNGFKFDADTGIITMANDDTITSQKGINENTSNAAKLATTIAQYASLNPGTFLGTNMSLNSTYQLESGYYVIYATNTANDGSIATKPILVDVKTVEGESGINLTLKDAKVELTKEIVNDDTHSAKQNVASIGDIIEYEVTTNFPIYEADAFANATKYEPEPYVIKATNLPEQSHACFYIHDELHGLDLIHDSLTVTVDGTEYEEGMGTFAISFGGDYSPYTIAFEEDFILDHQGESIVVNYEAVLNYEATVNSEIGNKNDVTVAYTSNPEHSEDLNTLVDETQTFSFAIIMGKIDGATEENLPGVEFEMYDENNHLMKFIYDDEMHIYWYISPENPDYEECEEELISTIVTTTGEMFVGLKEGTYKLVETNPLPGYAVLGNDAQITIVANEGTNNELTLYRGQTVASILDGSATITSQYCTLIDLDEDVEEYAFPTETNEAIILNDNDEGVQNSNIVMLIRNYKGVSLPETGSTGAIILTVVGGVVVVGGLILLLVLKRKKDDDDEEEEEDE